MGRLLYLDPTGTARVDRRNKHITRTPDLDRVYQAYRLLQGHVHYYPTPGIGDGLAVATATHILLGKAPS